MRNDLLQNIAIASLVVVTASFADAEPALTGRNEVGGQLGGIIVQNDAKWDTNHLMWGARIGHYFSDDLSTEFGMLVGQADVKDADDNADLYLPTTEAHLHLPRELSPNLFGTAVRPFAAAGIGVLSADGPSGANNAEIVFPIGGGLKWLLTEELALRFDARYMLNTEGGDEQHMGSLTGGLSWMFGGQEPTPKAAPVPKPQQAMPEAARALARDGQVSVNLNVEFSFDRSDIRPEFEGRLKEFAAFMEQHPNTVAEIEGHTDNVGSRAYNDKLSARRADAIRHWLAGRGGIDRSRLFAKGYGFSKPVADNSTESGRARNRRVVGTVRVVRR